MRKTGLNPEDFIDYDKINYALKGENKPQSPIETPQVSQETTPQEFSEVPNTTSPIEPTPSVEPSIKPQPIETTPKKTESKPKIKRPESDYYFVPNEFLEDNPPKVGQSYISLPNVMEYLGITPKEYKELSQNGYIGAKKIDGVPYVPVSMVEGKNYFKIMTYLNDRDLEAKKQQSTIKNTPTEKPATKKPANKKPATKKPATKKPETKKQPKNK
jgi:hypothetical protein